MMSLIGAASAAGGISKKRGYLLFFGAGAVGLACWWSLGSVINWATEPTSAPNCYWADEAYVPGNQTMPLAGARDRNGVPNNRRRMSKSDIDKVLAAEKFCTPIACTPQAAKDYRSAFFWYIEPRLQHIKHLDMAYGDNGLRLARTIYSEPIDKQLEKGLRERYEAQKFRINDSRQNRDAMAILVFKGGEALRSCRKSDL